MSGRVRAFIVLAGLAILALSLYREPLWCLISNVLGKKDSSHGLCVPFISVYLVWLKFQKIRETKPKFALASGTVMAGIGMLLFFLARDSTAVAVSAFSFLLVAAALVVGFFGKDVFKELRFPLFFLATMIPVPRPLYAQMAEWMGWATTSGSVWALQLFHFPIYRDGFTVSIPNMNLLVVESCTGIRHLISYFVFGLAYAFVCKKTIKSRFLVILAAIPMSIVGGIIRQSFIYVSAHFIGPFMASYRPHIIVGWSVFLAVLVGAMWMDRRISKSIRRIRERREAKSQRPNAEG